jgi:hypothetical protein
MSDKNPLLENSATNPPSISSCAARLRRIGGIRISPTVRYLNAVHCAGLLSVYDRKGSVHLLVLISH